MSQKDSKGPYEAGFNHEGTPCVHGPGDGFGFYDSMLFPISRCESVEAAEIRARQANVAYREGYDQARRDIRAALGLGGV
jgi:hypothetical protein